MKKWMEEVKKGRREKGGREQVKKGRGGVRKKIREKVRKGRKREERRGGGKEVCVCMSFHCCRCFRASL